MLIAPREELGNYVDWQREYDGRVLLGGNCAQRLQIPELKITVQKYNVYDLNQ
jgi:hypothetical protein